MITKFLEELSFKKIIALLISGGGFLFLGSICLFTLSAFVLPNHPFYKQAHKFAEIYTGSPYGGGGGGGGAPPPSGQQPPPQPGQPPEQPPSQPPPGSHLGGTPAEDACSRFSAGDYGNCVQAVTKCPGSCAFYDDSGKVTALNWGPETYRYHIGDMNKPEISEENRAKDDEARWGQYVAGAGKDPCGGSQECKDLVLASVGWGYATFSGAEGGFDLGGIVNDPYNITSINKSAVIPGTSTTVGDALAFAQKTRESAKEQNKALKITDEAFGGFTKGSETYFKIVAAGYDPIALAKASCVNPENCSQEEWQKLIPDILEYIAKKENIDIPDRVDIKKEPVVAQQPQPQPSIPKEKTIKVVTEGVGGKNITSVGEFEVRVEKVDGKEMLVFVNDKGQKIYSGLSPDLLKTGIPESIYKEIKTTSDKLIAQKAAEKTIAVRLESQSLPRGSISKKIVGIGTYEYEFRVKDGKIVLYSPRLRTEIETGLPVDQYEDKIPEDYYQNIVKWEKATVYESFRTQETQSAYYTAPTGSEQYVMLKSVYQEANQVEGGALKTPFVWGEQENTKWGKPIKSLVITGLQSPFQANPIFSKGQIIDDGQGNRYVVINEGNVGLLGIGRKQPRALKINQDGSISSNEISIDAFETKWSFIVDPKTGQKVTTGTNIKSGDRLAPEVKTIAFKPSSPCITKDTMLVEGEDGLWSGYYSGFAEGQVLSITQKGEGALGQGGRVIVVKGRKQTLDNADEIWVVPIDQPTAEPVKLVPSQYSVNTLVNTNPDKKDQPVTVQIDYRSGKPNIDLETKKIIHAPVFGEKTTIVPFLTKEDKENLGKQRVAYRDYNTDFDSLTSEQQKRAQQEIDKIGVDKILGNDYIDDRIKAATGMGRAGHIDDFYSSEEWEAMKQISSEFRQVAGSRDKKAMEQFEKQYGGEDGKLGTAEKFLISSPYFTAWEVSGQALKKPESLGEVFPWAMGNVANVIAKVGVGSEAGAQQLSYMQYSKILERTQEINNLAAQQGFDLKIDVTKYDPKQQAYLELAAQGTKGYLENLQTQRKAAAAQAGANLAIAALTMGASAGFQALAPTTEALQAAEQGVQALTAAQRIGQASMKTLQTINNLGGYLGGKLGGGSLAKVVTWGLKDWGAIDLACDFVVYGAVYDSIASPLTQDAQAASQFLETHPELKNDPVLVSYVDQKNAQAKAASEWNFIRILGRSILMNRVFGSALDTVRGKQVVAEGLEQALTRPVSDAGELAESLGEAITRPGQVDLDAVAENLGVPVSKLNPYSAPKGMMIDVSAEEPVIIFDLAGKPHEVVRLEVVDGEFKIMVKDSAGQVFEAGQGWKMETPIEVPQKIAQQAKVAAQELTDAMAAERQVVEAKEQLLETPRVVGETPEDLPAAIKQSVDKIADADLKQKTEEVVSEIAQLQQITKEAKEAAEGLEVLPSKRKAQISKNAQSVYQEQQKALDKVRKALASYDPENPRAVKALNDAVDKARLVAKKTTENFITDVDRALVEVAEKAAAGKVAVEHEIDVDGRRVKLVAAGREGQYQIIVDDKVVGVAAPGKKGVVEIFILKDATTSQALKGLDPAKVEQKVAEEMLKVAQAGKTLPAPPTPRKALSPQEIKQFAENAANKLKKQQLEEAVSGFDIEGKGEIKPNLKIARGDLPPEIGKNFQAHGIAKGSPKEQLDSLIKLLDEGPDPSKTLYTNPLKIAGEEQAAGISGAVGVYDDGGFIIIGHPGKQIQEEGIAAVLVNEHFYDAIPKLKEAYPDIRFIRADEMGSELENLLRSPIKKAGIAEQAVPLPRKTSVVQRAENTLANTKLGQAAQSAGYLKSIDSKWYVDSPKLLSDIRNRLSQNIGGLVKRIARVTPQQPTGQPSESRLVQVGKKIGRTSGKAVAKGRQIITDSLGGLGRRIGILDDQGWLPQLRRKPLPPAKPVSVPPPPPATAPAGKIYYQPETIRPAKDTPLSIGRNVDNNIVILDAADMTVSRKHAAITFENGRLYIEDLNSTNGTFIIRNGQKIPVGKKALIYDGDVIQLGIKGTQFKVVGNNLEGPYFGQGILSHSVPVAANQKLDLAVDAVLTDPRNHQLIIEGIIYNKPQKAQSLINEYLIDQLQKQGLSPDEALQALPDALRQVNADQLIKQAQVQAQKIREAQQKTVPLIGRDIKQGLVPEGLPAQQIYTHSYTSSGGEILNIDAANEPQLREAIDRAVDFIVEQRTQGGYSQSRLDLLSDWIRKRVNYSQALQDAMYRAGGGKAGLGKIILDSMNNQSGAVCREKAFFANEVLHKMGFDDAEVWVFNFKGDGRHAVNFIPSRGLLVDATNLSTAVTIDQYRMLGEIDWSSLQRYGKAVTPEVEAIPLPKPASSNASAVAADIKAMRQDPQIVSLKERAKAVLLDQVRRGGATPEQAAMGGLASAGSLGVAPHQKAIILHDALREFAEAVARNPDEIAGKLYAFYDPDLGRINYALVSSDGRGLYFSPQGTKALGGNGSIQQALAAQKPGYRFVAEVTTPKGAAKKNPILGGMLEAQPNPCALIGVVEGYEKFDKPFLTLWDRILIIFKNILNAIQSKPRPPEIFLGGPCGGIFTPEGVDKLQQLREGLETTGDIAAKTHKISLDSGKEVVLEPHNPSGPSAKGEYRIVFGDETIGGAYIGSDGKIKIFYIGDAQTRKAFNLDPDLDAQAAEALARKELDQSILLKMAEIKAQLQPSPEQIRTLAADLEQAYRAKINEIRSAALADEDEFDNITKRIFSEWADTTPFLVDKLHPYSTKGVQITSRVIKNTMELVVNIRKKIYMQTAADLESAAKTARGTLQDHFNQIVGASPGETQTPIYQSALKEAQSLGLNEADATAIAKKIQGEIIDRKASFISSAQRSSVAKIGQQPSPCAIIGVVEGYEKFDKPLLTFWDRILIVLKNVWNAIWGKPRPAEIFAGIPCGPARYLKERPQVPREIDEATNILLKSRAIREKGFSPFTADNIREGLTEIVESLRPGAEIPSRWEDVEALLISRRYVVPSTLETIKTDKKAFTQFEKQVTQFIADSLNSRGAETLWQSTIERKIRDAVKRQIFSAAEVADPTTFWRAIISKADSIKISEQALLVAFPSKDQKAERVFLNIFEDARNTLSPSPPRAPFLPVFQPQPAGI